MAQSHVISAIFLTLVSANMIQGGIIPEQLFREQAFPNFVNLAALPKAGELSHNFASSAATAASNAFDGFREYVDTFRNGLARHIEIPSRYPALNRFMQGEIWPNLPRPAAGVVPGHLVAPGPTGGLGGNNGATSAAASSAAAGAKL